MKRKTYSSLALRKTKKFKEDDVIEKKVSPVIYKFCGMSDILRFHLLPFLDEWTTYNLARVDKACSIILKDVKMTDSEGCSLLSMHFKRNSTCCICFGKVVTKNSNYCVSNGLFCHYQCMPSVEKWFISELGVPSNVEFHNDQKNTSVTLFENKNPCFLNNIKTLSYYLEQNYPTSHTALMLKDDVEIMEKYKGYFKEYYKSEKIKSLYNENSKVTFGGVRVSVVMVFNHLYPNFYAMNEPENIVKKYIEVENRIRQVHNSARIYHATHIRPKVLESNGWGSFIKTPILGVLKNDTFIGFVFKIGGFAQPENINRFMHDNVDKVRNYQIGRVLKKSTEVYINTIMCSCNQCKSVLTGINVNIPSLISDQFVKEYAKMERIPSSDELQKLTWKLLEKVILWWTDIRDIPGVKDSNINFIAFLAIGRYHKRLDDLLAIIKSLLINGFNSKDIHSAYLKMSDMRNMNYEWYKTTIVRQVMTRIRCYCGRKPQMLYAFCTKHRLCLECCNDKQCFEESLIADTDSSDDEMEVVELSD